MISSSYPFSRNSLSFISEKINQHIPFVFILHLSWISPNLLCYQMVECSFCCCFGPFGPYSVIIFFIFIFLANMAVVELVEKCFEVFNCFHFVVLTEACCGFLYIRLSVWIKSSSESRLWR